MAVLVVLVLALGGCVTWLGIRYFGQRTLDVDRTCMEPDCLRASAMLRASVNTSVSPCGGVWEFSCGKWLQSNPIPPTKSRWGVFDKLRFQAIEEYRSLVNTLPQPLEADQLPWKLKHFYDSCMDLDNINIDKASQLLLEIKQFGGWAVLRNWNQNTFDHHSVLKKLHATYRVEPFFSIRVVPDDKNPGSTIIKIGPAKLTLPDKSYYMRSPDDPMILAYERFVEDTVREFGAAGPDAKAFAETMFHLEKRIAEFTPDIQDSENSVLTYNKISLKSLKTIAGSVPWLEIIREVYPDAEVTQGTSVLIVSKKYVQDVSQLFYANDKQALNNFLMWKLAEAMVPYLSTQFRAIYDLFRLDIGGARKPLERWEMCTNTLEQNFNFAVGALTWERTENRREIQRTVEEMFEHLRTEFIKHVKDNDLLAHEMKDRSVEKIEKMKLFVGYPDKMMEPGYLNTFYGKMTVQRGAFYRNILYGSYFRRMTEQQALRSPDEEFVWRDALLADQPTYVHQANALVVPPYVLHTPFFDPKFPRSFNYGSVGTLLGKAMLGALDEVGVHYTCEGVLDPVLQVHVNVSVIEDFEPSPARATSEHLVVPRNCLKRAYMELELGNADEVDRAVNCSSVDVAGLRLALRALESSIGGAESEPPQPGLPYFPEGIFFLSYAQMFCGEIRASQEKIDLLVSRCFPPKTRLRAILTQLDEFGYAFECDGGDWSSSTRKCGRIL